MNPCILVFGMPRSGTTWIGKLFDSHPDTLYRHEPDSVRRLSMPLFPEKEDAPRYRDELERFVASLPSLRSAKVVGKQPLFPKSYQSGAGLSVYRASVAIAKVLSRIHRNIPCFYRPAAERSERARLVWKSIESSGRLGVCVEALSHVRAIHVVRHPGGYVASKLRGEAAHRFDNPIPGAESTWLLEALVAMAVGKAHGLKSDSLKQFTSAEQMAWCWVLIQEKILADIAGSDRVLTVRYEDVCAEPVAVTQRMFEFADLDWQPQTEAFIRASTQAVNADYYSVFKNPQASAERWRSELAPEVIERIQRILRSSSLHRFYNDDVQTPAALPEAVS